jgi:hypothetical protein
MFIFDGRCRQHRLACGGPFSVALTALLVFPSVCVAQPAAKRAEDPSARPSAPSGDPRKLPGLICFWDFQEAAGTPRRAQGPHRYALEERNGPIERIHGGVWGPYSAQIKRGQWFRIQRRDCPALNLHGPGVQYTILAWLKRMEDYRWQYVAGVWDEKNAARQYALFISGSLKTSWRTLRREPVDHRVHAYASAEGGGTPPSGICLTYSTGATNLEKDRWYFLAAAYDQQDLRAYVDGRLDALEDHNPYHYPGKPIFDGGATGADFTVGQRAVPGWSSYPEGKFLSVNKKVGPLGFDGILSALAVYDRALSAAEVANIHAWVQAGGPRRDR